MLGGLFALGWVKPAREATTEQKDAAKAARTEKEAHDISEMKKRDAAAALTSPPGTNAAGNRKLAMTKGAIKMRRSRAMASHAPAWQQRRSACRRSCL